MEWSYVGGVNGVELCGGEWSGAMWVGGMNGVELCGGVNEVELCGGGEWSGAMWGGGEWSGAMWEW